MKLKHVMVDLRGQARSFFRVKSNLFWVFAFPLLLIIIFGAIFSNLGSGTVTLSVQNLDEGPGSQQLLAALNETSMVKIEFISPSADLEQHIKDNSLTYVMVIPANFSANLASNVTAGVELRLDETVSTSSAVFNIVNGVVNTMNLQMAGGEQHITIEVGSIVQKRFTFLDFFVPGIIGLTIMTTCVFNVQGTISRFRTNGIFRKLATTPMTPFEWLLSRILWHLFISFLTLAVIMGFGMLIFGMNMSVNLPVVLMIVAGSAMFSALGMMVARFVKNEETASMAANAITFPMMFLSGTFFQLEMMPSYLQQVAAVLPLTYMSQGLRDAMVYDNQAGAYFNLAVVAVIGVIFVIVAVLITKWEEE
ncbi:MAG: ABC-2 family transporter protein [Methanomassiliicoccales archaeon PtaB.Bin215]|nr:MAG: ABC-2 family transporter protein [Methanomassiliicoccales archaeon PtaB.Bin215]